MYNMHTRLRNNFHIFFRGTTLAFLNHLLRMQGVVTLSLNMKLRVYFSTYLLEYHVPKLGTLSFAATRNNCKVILHVLPHLLLACEGIASQEEKCT